MLRKVLGMNDFGKESYSAAKVMSANRNIDEKESVIMADIVYCYNDEVYFNLTNK